MDGCTLNLVSPMSCIYLFFDRRNPKRVPNFIEKLRGEAPRDPKLHNNIQETKEDNPSMPVTKSVNPT
jgi:hypothetical protein